MFYENHAITFTSSNLKDLREDYGLSQQKLGDLVGLTQVTISKYECGSVEIPPRAQRLFNRFFSELERDIQLEELIREWDERVQRIVSEGIKAGRFEEGTNARSLPSTRNVVRLLDRLKNL